MDYIFGGFSEWFGALQGRSIGSQHCTLTQDEWTSHLCAAGFSEITWAREHQPTVRHISFMAQAAPFSSQLLIDHAHHAQLHHSSLPYYHWQPSQETRLVEWLSTLDSTKPLSLWLHSEDSASGRALLGIGRSLQHEFPLWCIHTVLFDSAWDSIQQVGYINQHLISLSWVDPDIVVAPDGSMLVSRLISWPDPHPTRTLRNGEILALDSSHSTARSTYLPPVICGNAEVSIDHVTSDSWFEPLAEFTGTITGLGPDADESAPSLKVGQRYV